MLPSLPSLLKYQNEDVKERFILRHPDYASAADELFYDLLRYFWICEHHHSALNANPDEKCLQFRPVMHEEMRMIDEMWHEFILMTRDYELFCFTYFGKFLHHQVNMNRQRPSEERLAKETELFLHYIYDNLGEATLKRWFSIHFVSS